MHGKKEKYVFSMFQSKMILNEEGCHYIAVKKLSALLRGITSKHHGDFYCHNCLHSLATEKKCQPHKKLCQN